MNEWVLEERPSGEARITLNGKEWMSGDAATCVRCWVQLRREASESAGAPRRPLRIKILGAIAAVMQWIQDRLIPAPMDTVPFSEVLENTAFWWDGECYVKSTEVHIFRDKPMMRPFPYHELVEILREPCDEKEES